MQVTRRWRNILSINNQIQIIPSSISHFSAFHSTPSSSHKRNTNPDIKKGQQPSKNQIKFATRQKRADTKKALKNLLYNSGASGFSFVDKQTKWKHDGNSDARSNSNSSKGGNSDARSNSNSSKGQPKSGRRFGGKPQKKTKPKIRREGFYEDIDGHPEQIFQATFGNKHYTWSFCDTSGTFSEKGTNGATFGNKHYTWSFSNMGGTFSEHSTSSYGFEWREYKNRTNTNKWKTASDDEYDENDKDDDASCRVGSSSDRTILGLPPTGPLKIEDVKNAFRLSALKWHPDRHQGPSQAIAGEKFKLCVNAYKTLCNALSPA